MTRLDDANDPLARLDDANDRSARLGGTRRPFGLAWLEDASDPLARLDGTDDHTRLGFPSLFQPGHSQSSRWNSSVAHHRLRKRKPGT
ncbi:hypothetical protein ABZ942_25025, partial [Nocardia sp. NPDC046473]|uniref:hypothetical protein n=1 Tax=Nocardia sp. NPDC046473 TaxID=3155733 RepID=UPI003405CED8